MSRSFDAMDLVVFSIDYGHILSRGNLHRVVVHDNDMVPFRGISLEAVSCLRCFMQYQRNLLREASHSIKSAQSTSQT